MSYAKAFDAGYEDGVCFVLESPIAEWPAVWDEPTAGLVGSVPAEALAERLGITQLLDEDRNLTNAAIAALEFYAAGWRDAVSEEAEKRGVDVW